MAYSIGPNGNFILDQNAPWYQNMWNSTMYAWAQNPTAPLQSIGDWWGVFNNYKMARNNYNLTKIIYEDTLTLKELIPVNRSNSIVINKQNI